MTSNCELLSTERQLRRLLWWCRLNAALFLTLLLGWLVTHLIVQVPPLDEVQIALETEPGHPGAEGHISHVTGACLPSSNAFDSEASCVVAYLDRGKARIRQLHFRHTGQATPEAFDLWRITHEPQA